MKIINVNVFALIISLFAFQACSKDSEMGDIGINRPGEKIFKAGVSTVNVTGRVPEGQVVNDSLKAKTLVLDDGSDRLVIVVIDKTTVPREVLDEVKRMISEEHNIPTMNIMMAPTHTHNATPVYLEGNTANGFGYTQRFSWNLGRSLQTHQSRFVREVVYGVRNAIANLEPARIGWGVGSVPQWAHNRRWILKEQIRDPFGEHELAQYHPGRSNTNRDRPAGPVDPEVPFIAVQSLDGKPISIFANYSIHHAGDLQGIPPSHISADYWGVFSTKMADLVGANNQSTPFLGIMSNGTSADVSSYNYAYEVTDPENGPYVRVNAVAHDVANEVYRVYQNIEYHDWVSLHAVQSELPIRVRRADPELYDYLEGRLATPRPPQWHSRDQTQAYMALQLEKEWPDVIPTILQVFKIGDVGICAVPFEVFAEMGLEIKEKSPFAPTFTMGIANGTYGYLPTPAQHELGGYETWMGGSNKAEINASVLITDRLLSMMNSLKNIGK